MSVCYFPLTTGTTTCWVVLKVRILIIYCHPSFFVPPLSGSFQASKKRFPPTQNKTRKILCLTPDVESHKHIWFVFVFMIYEIFLRLIKFLSLSIFVKTYRWSPKPYPSLLRPSYYSCFAQNGPDYYAHTVSDLRVLMLMYLRKKETPGPSFSQLLWILMVSLVLDRLFTDFVNPAPLLII